MCGIAGILRLDGAPADPAALHRMAALMRHRGPDGQGFAAFPSAHGEPPLLWTDARRPPPLGGAVLGLAHRRLSILDLSEAGHQPMSSADGRYWTVLNGEIYNHADLRTALASKGHLFRGRSDTEVLLAAWSEWGEACLERLEGMFAFALWDRPGHRLFLVRDRFGIKPLYYASTPSALAFASEIKPVLSALALPVEPLDAAVYELLVRGRKDHRDTTFFKGVMQVPPGHLLELRGHPRPYYDLASAVHTRIDGLPPDPEGRIRLFREALEASVRSHLVSDVPVGGCLSGGLDSSALAGIAARSLRFRTFSARSEDPALDEGRWQEAVVRKTGLPNHAVTPDAAGFWDALPDLLWFQEEPFPSGSLYAQWRVMQEASAHGVKVMLDGQGADEILGGYPGTHLWAVAEHLRSLRWKRALVEAWGYGPGFPRLRGLAASAWISVCPAARGGASLAEGGRDRYLRHELVSSAPDPLLSETLPGLFRTERASLLAQNLPALLHYEDRDSMAHGIEARVPFLDRALVEISIALPPDDLLDHGMTKRILRRAAEDVLPGEILARRDKIGFATADRAWIRAATPRLKGMLDAFEAAGSRWVDWKRVRKELPRFLEGPALVPDLLALLVVELWRRQAASPGYLDPR